MLHYDEKFCERFINLLNTEFPSHKNSFRTSQETHYIFATKISGLMLLFAVTKTGNRRRKQSSDMLKQMVHTVSTGLLKVFDWSSFNYEGGGLISL
jgi:hypothetical protein